MLGEPEQQTFFSGKTVSVLVNLSIPFKGSFWGNAMVFFHHFHPSQMVRSDTEKFLDHVNPGLINPV